MIGKANALTDVAGLRVGHAQRVGDGWLSGVTAVLAPPGGAVAAVDVRGGGPGTRETDALDPRNLVQRVEAVVLTGGSAFGLDSAGGVVSWLEEQGRGFRVGPDPSHVVPVVPAAALFDLGRGGDWRARPGAEMGRAAAEAAWASGEGAPVAQGSVGAGTGAVAGGMKGGIGTASVVLEDSGVTVAALAAVNAAGSPVNPQTGLPYGAFAELDGEFGGLSAAAPLPEPVRARAAARLAEANPANTTLAVVATDADLTRAQAQKLAGAGQDGLARAIRPAHLLNDGDTVFALATGARPLLPTAPTDPAFGIHTEAGALNALLSATADTLTRAIVHALLTPHSITPHYLTYRALYT